MTEFLQRLKQRKLVQWALAYIAAAFALLQGIDIVAQQFGWPDAVRRGITLALVVGFFVTLVLAWYHGERGYATYLAMIYAWVGEKDLALKELELSASIPAGVQYGLLKLSPNWDSLRGDPRFEKIVNSLAPRAAAAPQPSG